MLNVFMDYLEIYRYIQLVAFGILFPIGAVFAIMKTKITDRWFYYHLSCQGVAVLLLLVGFSILYIHTFFIDGHTTQSSLNYHIIFHKIAGLIVAVAGTLYMFI